MKEFNHNKVYIVSGMHRSGTSFLAKALKDQGVDMGKELLPGNRFNIDGHFENVKFVTLSGKILNEAGGQELEPPSRESIHKSADSHSDEIVSLINRSQGKFWGWKDPRNSLTMQEFLPYIDGDVYLVCIFRKPSKVAESLYKRQELPIDRGLLLSKYYIGQLIQTIKEFCSL